MDIFKMANQIAQNMSDTEKDSLEGMDMEKMIGHVTKNVFQMMGNTTGGGGSGGMPDFSQIFSGLSGGNKSEATLEEPSEVTFLKTRDIFFELNVDLEDFYTGKKKKLNVKRKRIIEVDGKQKVVEEKKKLVIPIERGMKDEQQIRFEGQADQIPGYTPGDIIITLIENEHPVFQRDNDNLIIIKNCTIYELYSISFDITHLDSRVLRIDKNDIESLHTNNSLRKITGQGMPVYKNQNEFGDLFVRFNLVIPKTIDTKHLQVCKEIFGISESVAETFSNKFILQNVSETDLEDFESDYSESESSDSELSSVSTGSDSSDSEIVSKKRPSKR
jgi:DnaJ-class molecular chaperone